jgi:serpin B
MKLRRLATLLGLSSIIACVLLWACGGGNGPTVQTAKSDKQRITSPQVTSQELADQAKQNNTFALELFQKVRGTGNLFVSPHSISTALAMLYGGARTTTEQEMSKTLHYPLPQGNVHGVFNKLDLELASRGKTAVGADGTPFQLTVANALWGRPDGKYLPDYLDLLALNYGAGMNLVDFGHDPEGARQTINAWVAAQTRDRIKDLLHPDDIDKYVALVLTNAIYFNAGWDEKFEKGATQQAGFDADGGVVNVQMMAGMKNRASYGAAAGVEALELPFDGKELSMVVLLPAAGTFKSYVAGLTWSGVEAALATLAPTPVYLRLPRFELTSRRQLADALQSLGMVQSFSDGADFSGITGNPPGTPGAIKVAKVIHQAFVQCAEGGIEAAAATAVVMKDAGAIGPGTPPFKLTVDRPFLFLIRDKATGAVLFTGQIVDPTAGG